VAGECENKGKMHVFDDHFYPEIIDPETEQPLPDGEVGELIFTCLTKRAFPVIRFRRGTLPPSPTNLQLRPYPCSHQPHHRPHR